MRGRGLAGTRQTVERRDSTTQGPSPLRAALLLTACVWCVLLAGRAAARWLDPAWAVAGSFAVAAALVSFAGPPGAHAAARHPRLVEGAALLLGLGAGYSLFPAWLALTWVVGHAIGLDPELLGARVPPLAGSPILWLAGVVLAPAFEEPLYRGVLLPALRPKLGAALAIFGSSALFALPHVLPWTVLGVFLGGLGLGAVMHWGRSLALCIGIHAGLNLAGVLHGVPPSQHALQPLAGVIATAAALAVAFGLLHTARPARVHCGALAIGAGATSS